MLESLRLSKPLVFMDIESTGLDVLCDRIVEIALIKFYPDGQQEEWHQLVNPGCAIPKAATAVHGIDDSKVADEPSFAELAPDIQLFLEETDLCGFGISRLDVPMLVQEFRRCGQVFSLTRRTQVDLLKIYHHMQPRNLSSAVRDYLQRDHLDAHSARHDALACVDLLEAMLQRHQHLAHNLALLKDQDQPAQPLLGSKVVYHKGQPCFNFGRYKEETISAVVKKDPNYLRWILTESFPESLKHLIREALPSSGNDICDPSFFVGDTFR